MQKDAKKKGAVGSSDEVIFFDVDDTLYRRAVPFCEAAGIFFADRGTPLCREELEKAYISTQQRCEEVFSAMQAGELSEDESYIYRYTKGFGDVGITVSAEEALVFRDAYRKAQKNIRPEPRMREYLDRCRKEYSRTGIITNGRSAHQRAKIKALGLEEWVDEDLIVISGEIGIDKPDPGIFRYAQTLAGLPAEKLTYVGDSMENDILPAQRAGWKTVYVCSCIPADIIKSRL